MAEEECFTITIISDLEKGFEKVGHDHIAEATDKYGFPKRILRLALDMYRAARSYVMNP